MKKKLFAAVMAVIMTLLQTAFYTSAQEEPTEFGTILLEEDFENADSDDGASIIGWNDWEQDYDGTATSTYNSSNTIVTEDGNKVASIKRTATSATDLGSYFFKKSISAPEDTDVISVKFKARRNDTNAAGLIVRLYGPNAGNNGIVESDTYFYMNAGKGYLWWKDNIGAATYRYALGGANEIGVVNNWYDIEIRVDYKNEKIEAYIENEYAGYAPLKSAFSNIYGLPVAISFGTQRAATYWGGMASNASDAEFQVDDIAVTAYQGNLAYSSPKNGEEALDINTSEIEMVFNYEIEDASDAQFTLDSDETEQVPLIEQIIYDSENLRKVTLLLNGAFDYGKRYTLCSTGIKNAYQKEMLTEIEFRTRERSFIINIPEFTMEDELLDSITDGVVNAKIRIDNEFDSDKPLAVAAISFLENGQINDIDYNVTEVGAEEYIEPVLEVNATSDGQIRLFLIDSFSALTPICNEYVFDSEGLSEYSEVVFATATSVAAAVDYEGDGLAEISGNADEGHLTILVLKPNFTLSDLTEENRDNAINMIEYIGMAEGEAYSETYIPRVPVDTLNYYNAYATGISTPTSFRVFDAETVTKVLDAVKNSTKKTLGEMLKAENPTLIEGSLNINDVLALDLTEYYTLLDPQLVTAEIAGKSFENVNELRILYSKVLKEKLEYEKTGITLVNAVNEALWSELEALLEKNDEILLIDWTGDYKKIKNKDNFYKKLAHDYSFDAEGVTVDTAIEKIRESFSELAKAVLKQESKSSSSSGKGGGGGGGKTIKLPVQTVVLPEAEEEQSGISFNDIDNVPWAETAIKELAKKNIINGVGNDEFEPNATVTREQFVKMLVLAFELPMEFSDAPFVDVTAADWYYHYVHTAYKNGIVQASSSFGAGKAITREEMAVMCYRAAQTCNIKLDNSSSLDFTDNSSISDYAKEAVAALANSGIINGMGDNTFAPKNSSSRAQAAKIIYGILQLKGGVG